MQSSWSADVLFVAYGGGHAQMVTPVIKALGDRARIAVLALPSAIAHFRRSNIPALTFADLLDPTTDQNALAWGEALAQQHHADHTGIARSQSVAYLGLSYADLVGRLGSSEAEARMARMGRHAFHPITVLDRALDLVQPRVVVATNSPRAEAAAIEAGNLRGLSTLSMTDVFMAMKHHRNQAQDITYLNRFAMENLARIGIVNPDRSQAHFTGNPAFDALFKTPAASDRAWQAAEFPDAKDKPVFLFADMVSWVEAGTNASHTQTEAQVAAQLEACADAAEQAGVILAIRPHPSQDPGPHERIVSERAACVLARHQPLHDLLRNVEGVIARSSTVALETVILRQKLLQLEPDKHPDMPLASLGTAWGVPEMSELAQVIETALADTTEWRSIKSRIEHHFPAQIASEAIADLILHRLEQAS
ncbi:hypothetical protein [uncultured Roseobacter sp.]|uniref:hypothetical protein n=1 Tax=uncultured Roseobacter sp. TaxID=114847 RepID=UPI002623EF0B|nr:hypothetical protein [uncultured Roseobacter sp.]